MPCMPEWHSACHTTKYLNVTVSVMLWFMPFYAMPWPQVQGFNNIMNLELLALISDIGHVLFKKVIWS